MPPILFKKFLFSAKQRNVTLQRAARQLRVFIPSRKLWNVLKKKIVLVFTQNNTHANFAGQMCLLGAFYCGPIWVCFNIVHPYACPNGNWGTHSEINSSGSFFLRKTTRIYQGKRVC